MAFKSRSTPGCRLPAAGRAFYGATVGDYSIQMNDGIAYSPAFPRGAPLLADVDAGAYFAHLSSHSLPPSAVTTTENAESIAYGEQPKPRVKTMSCLHTIERVAGRTFDMTSRSDYQIYDPYWMYCDPQAPQYSHVYNMAENISLPIPATYEQPAFAQRSGFEARATSAMYPKLKSEIDGFVFIGELRDFKRLVATISRTTSNLQRLLDGAIEDGVDLLNTSVKEAAAWDLTNQFAVRPFVRDMARFVAGVADAGKRWNDMVQRGKLGQRVSYSERFDPVDQFQVDGSTFVSLQAVAQAKAWWRFKYAPHAGVNFDIWEWYGLSPSFRGFWELVPFSFVLDRLINLSGTLEFLDRDRRLTIESFDFGVGVRATSIKCCGYLSNSTSKFTVNQEDGNLGDHDLGNWTDNLPSNAHWSGARCIVSYDRQPSAPEYGVAAPIAGPGLFDASWLPSLAYLQYRGWTDNYIRRKKSLADKWRTPWKRVVKRRR